MGLALVASPLLVLVLGATTGVQMIQVVGLVVCLVSAWMLRRDINYGRVGILLAASLFGIVPGSWMARSLPSSWLMIVIGCITLLALFMSVPLTPDESPVELALDRGVATLIAGVIALVVLRLAPRARPRS